MKKRGKKGISPLIATVLLIGLVVSVAVVVMTWGRGFVKERAEKEGALSQAQLECNQIEIEVGNDYSVTNIGSIDIDGFIIRSSGSPEQKDTPQDVLKVSETKSYELGPGDEIIPAIRPEGAGAPLVPCSDKSKTLRVEGG